jgi:hypothetical protein
MYARKEIPIMENFDQFVAAVRTTLQPEPRANATASTLEQLGALVPEYVILADLAVAWQAIADNAVDGEDIPVQKRRETCGELAHLATLFTDLAGDISNACDAWEAWIAVFSGVDDPRQQAMAKTFARELNELTA